MTGNQSLTDGFQRLLTLLDADPDRAGAAYAAVQRKLTKFFEWRGCPDGVLYADITLERVARKLGEGAMVTAANPYSFVMGFANNVLREYLREPNRRSTSIDEISTLPAAMAPDPIEARGDREVEDRRFACLDECVGELAAEQRQALLTYHSGQAKIRIDARREMAAAFGISVSALRLRMFRIREGLERCIVQCMAGGRAAAK